MEIKQCNPRFLLIFSLFFTTISSGVHGIDRLQAQHPGHHHRQHYNHHYCRHGGVKLFVFGDSFVDTGNFNRNGGSWVEPYGYTFPHKPSGRFSDGRVITDYIASFLGIKSPIPYRWRKIANQDQLQHGMNFAYGGSGVFDTWIKNLPNLETQINSLKQLFVDQIYTKNDFANSVVLVSTSGNDYSFYLRQNGTLQDMSNFTRRLINQLAKNLKQIHELGVQKIAVAGIGPAGCFPQQTASSSYKICNENFNSASEFHNDVLKRALRKLNYENRKSVFIFLDFYSTFKSAINQHKHSSGNMDCKNPLRPCCDGVTSQNGCGQVHENGERKYVVCKHPELSFFWDWVHPSQNGWHSVYLSLHPTLRELLLH